MTASNTSECLKEHTNPLVSVVIPTFGARGALKKVVNSVLAQTYSPLEIIVVDDNHPDSDARKITERVMEEFVTQTCVQYIRHAENKNGAAARNTGIRHSKGSFIAFLDDDDCFLPIKLERQIDFLYAHPEFDAAYCFASKAGKAINCIPYEGDASLELLMGNTAMFTPSLVFRREPLENIHGFDERFRRHQDYELLLKFFSHGYKIGCLQERLLNLGTNAGENIIYGKKLEDLKANFLNLFDNVINELDVKKPGTKDKIYAHHYFQVFLGHVKKHYFARAAKIFFKYFPMSPSTFCRDFHRTIKAHLAQ